MQYIYLLIFNFKYFNDYEAYNDLGKIRIIRLSRNVNIFLKVISKQYDFFYPINK